MDVLEIDHNTRNKWRPDIAAMRKSHKIAGRKRMHRCYNTVTQVVEIGYTAESCYKDKEAEKAQQHSAFIEDLKDLKHEVDLHTIILGSTGGIFKSTLASLESLKIDKTQISKLKSAKTSTL